MSLWYVHGDKCLWSRGERPRVGSDASFTTSTLEGSEVTVSRVTTSHRILWHKPTSTFQWQTIVSIFSPTSLQRGKNSVYIGWIDPQDDDCALFCFSSSLDRFLSMGCSPFWEGQIFKAASLPLRNTASANNLHTPQILSKKVSGPRTESMQE